MTHRIGKEIPKIEDLPEDLKPVLKSFKRHLEATNVSSRTVVAYTEGVRVLARFLIEKKLSTDPKQITREHIEEFITSLLAVYTPSTANNRYRALQAFFGWCLDEGEILENPMAKTKPPMVPEIPVAVLDESDLKKMLKACDGKTFIKWRDKAMLLLLVDSGVRREELSGMKVSDVDLDRRVVVVFGKGRRQRTCPIGKKATMALDRYLRAREQHRHHESPNLWLGMAGPMTNSGIDDALDRIAREAGIGHVFPHQFLTTPTRPRASRRC